jgi:hypothetical protein
MYQLTYKHAIQSISENGGHWVQTLNPIILKNVIKATFSVEDTLLASKSD